MVWFYIVSFLVVFFSIYFTDLHIKELEKYVDEWNRENKDKNNGRMEIR